jgi:sugar/nucleoside kinase (ribokinase family)
VRVVDPTGAGDLFAGAFFVRYRQSGNPWSAARFAISLASASVTRPGLAGLPTREEIAVALG